MQYQNIIVRAVQGSDSFKVWYTAYLTPEEAEAREFVVAPMGVGEQFRGLDGHWYQVRGRSCSSRDLMMHPDGGYFANCEVLATRISPAVLVPIGRAGRNIRVRR